MYELKKLIKQGVLLVLAVVLVRFSWQTVAPEFINSWHRDISPWLMRQITNPNFITAVLIIVLAYYVIMFIWLFALDYGLLDHLGNRIRDSIDNRIESFLDRTFGRLAKFLAKSLGLPNTPNEYVPPEERRKESSADR